MEETGVVVEERGALALVRFRRGGHCDGCGSAAFCRAGRSEGEQLIEARNDIGAAAGDDVVVGVSTASVLRASFRVYLVPVIGLLLGAALAQGIVGLFASPEIAARGAGIGGILGAILAVLALRRLRGSTVAALPTILRVIEPSAAPQPPSSS